MGESSTADISALSLKNVCKTYKNGLQALKGIDLEVKAGDFFALLGPNGAGKSTTIGIISSLVNKSSGVVEVFGHNIDHALEKAKQCIGVVPQEINFNQFEKVSNILVNQAGFYGIGRREALVETKRCLHQLALWDMRNAVSRTLSGGMKRRLMIARALVHSPKLLILDEPTAGVDIEIRRSMWEFLRDINKQGTTIILTTHYLEEAEKLCRHIAIINHGRIVEHNTMEGLLAQLPTHHYLLECDAPLQKEPECPGYYLKQLDAYTLNVEIPNGQNLHALFDMLAAQSIRVRGLRQATNRLEQLFIHLVENRHLEKQGNE